MFERRVASRILSHYKMDNGSPIDVLQICKVQGISLSRIAVTGDGASGHYEEEDNKTIIYVNEERVLTHQRLTIAHCLGHYFMRHGTMPRETATVLRSRDPREISANRFAHELLMPKKVVERFLDREMSQANMAKAFNVSHESMGYRLENLGAEYDREYTF